MGQATFTCKQFAVKQDQCAMKVSTDACIFGAWAAQKITKLSLSSPRILDIGTGTGLLSLMIAQQITNFSITAIEIDEAAALQAKENFNKSPWNEHLHLKQADINFFSTDTQFDVIISNPPFYERDLLANTPAKNQAFHDSSLTLSTLLIASLKLLKPQGYIFLILPMTRKEDLVKYCLSMGISITTCCEVKPSPHKRISRILVECRKEKEVHPMKNLTTSLVIQGNNNGYSPEAFALLKDYYLHL
jgi:tRNA1Val (adenine37-N6)-methyltransferase